MGRKTGRKKGIGAFLRELWCEIGRDRYSFFVFCVLGVAVTLLLAHSILIRQWDRVFTGGLTLLLLLLPPLVEHHFRLRLPATLEILAYLFVFCAGILGEIGNFYQRFAFFDTLLHVANGYMFAAFGFCLLELFEREKAKKAVPSAALLSFVAFCFSMTVGTVWELFEHAADRFLGTDMQKDRILHAIHTVKLTGDEVQDITNITQTQIVTADGARVVLRGYLDIGLYDTMGDLWVNLLGALLYCAIGYGYLKTRRSALAPRFIPTVLGKNGGNPDTQT